MITFQDLVITAGHGNISIVSYGATSTDLTLFLEDRNNPCDNVSEATSVTLSAKDVEFMLKKKGLRGGLVWFKNQPEERRMELLSIILESVITSVYSELAA